MCPLLYLPHIYTLSPGVYIYHIILHHNNFIKGYTCYCLHTTNTLSLIHIYPAFLHHYNLSLVWFYHIYDRSTLSLGVHIYHAMLHHNDFNNGYRCYCLYTQTTVSLGVYFDATILHNNNFITGNVGYCNYPIMTVALGLHVYGNLYSGCWHSPNYTMIATWNNEIEVLVFKSIPLSRNFTTMFRWVLWCSL